MKRKQIGRKLLVLLCVLAGLVLSAAAAFAEEWSMSIWYPSTVGTKATNVTVTMDDDWFDRSSDSYYHDIAQLSLAMAMTSFRDNTMESGRTDSYIRSFLDNAGFTDYEAYGYDQATSEDTISNVIASAWLTDDRGSYVLLAVPVCGQGYGDEWLSNFTVGEGAEHEGFASAADLVYERVKAYIAEYCPGERVKVWATGFSRAAAVSNLLGDRLLRDEGFEQNDIFVYTFGTPNNTREPTAWPQIYNICGSFDPVPKIPLGDWGYGKHGTTLYLPCREDCSDYDELCVSAKAVYADMLGNADKFDAIPERNWLLMKLLDILHDAMPEAEDYTDAFQEAVKAAWRDKGSLTDRLNAMLTVLDESAEINDDVAAAIRDEVLEVVNLGVTDTVRSLTGDGGSSIWYDLLTSGMSLANEHFPEVYLSWMLSTDNPDDLFSHGDSCYRFMFSGNPELKIYRVNTQNGDKEELLNTATGYSSVAMVRLPTEIFVSLPDDGTYDILVTAEADGAFQAGYTQWQLANVHNPMKLTRAVTLQKGETVEIIAVKAAEGVEPQAIVDGNQVMTLEFAEDSAKQSTGIQSSQQRASSQFWTTVTGGVVMVPYLLTGLVLIIYAIVVIIKRLVRHRVDDSAQYTKAGMIVLIIAAAMSVTLVINSAMGLIAAVNHQMGIDLANRTLQRISEYMGLGTETYEACGLVMYVLLTVLCIKGIRHQLSRIRLVRLSLHLLLLNTLTTFLAKDINSLTIPELLTSVVPLTAFAGSIAVHVRTAEDERIGKRWLPVSRAIVFTGVIFFVRQVLVWVVGKEFDICVMLKALNGIPVAILAARLWKRRPTELSRMTFFAVLSYLVANTVINLSMAAGMAFYIVGHGLLLYGYYKTRKPDKKQLIVWTAIAVVLAVEVVAMRSRITGMPVVLGILYAMMISALFVLAFPISRRLRIGSIMFAIANQLLVLSFMFPGTFVLESAELLLYYIAVLMMTADPAALDASPTAPAEA